MTKKCSHENSTEYVLIFYERIAYVHLFPFIPLLVREHILIQYFTQLIEPILTYIFLFHFIQPQIRTLPLQQLR